MGTGVLEVFEEVRPVAGRWHRASDRSWGFGNERFGRSARLDLDLCGLLVYGYLVRYICCMCMYMHTQIGRQVHSEVAEASQCSDRLR